MPKTITIEERAVPWFLGLMSGGIGLMFLAFGFSLLVKLTIDSLRFFFGKANAPEHFIAFPFFIVISILLGVLLVWVFINPSKKVVFDAATQDVSVKYRYPFGYTRNDVFALKEIGQPEVVWHRNSDYSEDGYWKLTVTLPDGRKVERRPLDSTTTDQEEQAKVWRAEIEAIRQ
ncbi:MAG: hypothetical protein ACRBCL_17380 [Maritimibacter sp.]